MAVTSTPSFGKVYDENGNEILDQFYSPLNPLDTTVLTGSSFDTKIGYKFRSAAQRELYVILQDVEGTPLTDSAGEPLVSLIDGFVTSELTSEKALGVVMPTTPEEKQILEFTLFGDKFDLRRRQVGADPSGGDIPPYVEVVNPDEGFKYIAEKDILQISCGDVIFREQTYGATEFQAGAQYLTGQMFYVIINGTTARLYDNASGFYPDQDTTYLMGSAVPSHVSGVVTNGQCDVRFIGIGEVTPEGVVLNINDGREVEQFTIEEITESIDSNGNLVVRFQLNKNPSNEIRDTLDPSVTPDPNPISLIKKKLVLNRVGTVKIAEVFPSTSEVSSTLLGVDRSETQLGLFSNVSTYGFNPDEFVYYTDNRSIGPIIWTQRETEREGPHYQSRVEEVDTEGALKICSFPVPYTYPYPPLVRSINAQGNDTIGLYNEDKWKKWQNWVSLGKTLYEYFKGQRDLLQGTENYAKYDTFLLRFLPAINIWDDDSFYGGQFYGGSTTTYYRQISIWTETWNFINDGILRDPVTNLKINFDFLQSEQFPLRGTGTDTTIGSGSFPGEGNNGLDVNGNPTTPVTFRNPFEETWLNRFWISAEESGDPQAIDFVPGYDKVGGQFALLQSRQAFRYQPGRISGYTFGTRATMTKETAGNYAEWGIFNDFDEYVFRRDGANFFIVRRSTVHLPLDVRQELGVADGDGVDNTDLVKYYDKDIAGEQYSVQEITLPREKFNGDSLNGNGPSGYLLTTDEITMYKIEFGWYGAIGLRMYAYIPVENGKARWIVVHTFVIENKLLEPSMGDPFFRFKYEMRIGSQQAPRIDEPQILYKYGTSMYIDGGDEGTVSVFSRTSDTKNLPFQVGGGNYVSIFGIYPKTNIVSGGTDAQGNPVSVPNKKIIIPKSMSITATGVTPGETNAMAEINFTRCAACTGSSYLYMPNVSNGNHNPTRKLKKLPSDAISTSLSLAPIDNINILNVEGGQLLTSSSNFSYLRNGDFIETIIDSTDNTTVLLDQGHMVDVKYRGQTGTLTSGGSGYPASATYTDVELTGGTGDFITADIVVDSSGVIESVVPSVKGQEYTVGDVLSVDNANTGGQGSGLQFTLLGVDTYGFRILNINGSTLNVPDVGIIGETITVDPCFVLTESDRALFDLNYTDYKTKVIANKLWNTYISNVGGDFKGILPTTANIIGYVNAKRWDLEEQRRLSPSRIVESNNPVGGGFPTPAYIFGDPNTETFDVKMDAKSTIVASPQPLSGPTGIVKWLQNYFKDGTGNVREWEVGFTPNKPIFDQATGELQSWITPSGTPYVRPCYKYDASTDTYESNTTTTSIFLSDDKTVSLDYHPYSTTFSLTGFETGEDWYGRIRPFTEDFRIPVPEGTTSGVCAQARLLKQDTVTTTVEMVDTDEETIPNVFSNFLAGSFETADDLTAYLGSSRFWLRKSSSGSSTPPKIYQGTGDPTGGQVAINPQNTLSYIKFFFDENGANPQIARFSAPEKTYQITSTDAQGNPQTTTFNIIPIKDNVGGDVDIYDARDSNGAHIIDQSGNGQFNIAYNGVQMVAWFSGSDTNNPEEGRYNTPASYTGGGNNQAVFDFDAFPLYAFFKLRDGSQIRAAELHDIDELNNLSTQNPRWKRNFDQVIDKETGNFDGVDRTTYGLPATLETGQLNVNGVGDSIQQSNIPDDDVVPAAFQQVSRLSSANIDTQGESILRPGGRQTTLYINNETKYFDLEDVFGFDRKVLTPDVVNTEAMFIVGRAIGNTAVDIDINITYVEQL